MCGRTAAWAGGALRATGGASLQRTHHARARESRRAGRCRRGVVVPAGGSAENAGDAVKARTKRRSALKRMEGDALEPGLYVVATPIGNLGDITLRAVETLRAADVVAAEDTRNTRALLSHLGISARLVALHEHNERRGAVRVVEWLREGKRVALVTDAGTPGVSDPGAGGGRRGARSGLARDSSAGRERAYRGALGERPCVRGMRVRGISSRQGRGAAREARGAGRGTLGHRALRSAAPGRGHTLGPARRARRSRRRHRARDHQEIRVHRARAARHGRCLGAGNSRSHAWRVVLVLEGREPQSSATDPRSILEERLLVELPSSRRSRWR